MKIEADVCLVNPKTRWLVFLGPDVERKLPEELPEMLGSSLIDIFVYYSFMTSYLASSSNTHLAYPGRSEKHDSRLSIPIAVNQKHQEKMKSQTDVSP